MPNTTKDPTFSVYLTADELLLLDGKCSEDAQKEVDKAKARIEMRAKLTGLTVKQSNLIATLVLYAKSNLELGFSGKSLSSCGVCGEQGGYFTYTRNTHLHNKGDPNLKRPRFLAGVDFSSRSFVSIRGYSSKGCCMSCYEVIKPHLLDQLEGLRVRLPKRLTGVDPKYAVHKNKVCTECFWTGHEGEMILTPAIMSGMYPSTCPKCKAKNIAFNRDVVVDADGYTVVNVPKKEDAV